MKIIFKTEPVKYVHTKYGDFLYYKVVQYLKILNHSDSELAFCNEDEDIERWLIKTKRLNFLITIQLGEQFMFRVKIGKKFIIK